MTDSDSEKDLFDYLTDIETELANLKALSNIYHRLLGDDDWPEDYLMQAMCGHVDKLHIAFYKAWPLITAARA